MPHTAIEVITASLAEGTLKQYTACFKKYWDFCKRNNRDPLVYNLESYLEFLTEIFHKGHSFSVLNSYRSALNLIFNSGVSKDEKIINRFLKGVSHIRPPKPKYNFTWDPDPLLGFLSSWYPLESLSLENLTFKLTTLLALTSASRMQTLSLINIKNIKRSSEKIEIKISDRTKTSTVGKHQPVLIFPYYKGKPELCVASTIDFYIKTTESYRHVSDSLILTHKKPFHPASTQTISRWIKKTLYTGGIDTSFFSAYSVRHASTSAAFRAGVNISQIRNTAGWTPTSNTFFNFYNRPVKESTETFSNAIVRP